MVGLAEAIIILIASIRAHQTGEFPEIFHEKNRIEAAAGRPSGRRPFIISGGMGASAPIFSFFSFPEKKTSGVKQLWRN
jgi:hypothetical protein